MDKTAIVILVLTVILLVASVAVLLFLGNQGTSRGNLPRQGREETAPTRRGAKRNLERRSRPQPRGTHRRP